MGGQRQLVIVEGFFRLIRVPPGNPEVVVRLAESGVGRDRLGVSRDGGREPGLLLLRDTVVKKLLGRNAVASFEGRDGNRRPP